LDSGIIVTIILAVTGLAGFILALLGLRKSGKKKVEELRDQLNIIGVKAWINMIEPDNVDKGPRLFRGFKYLGNIKLNDKAIDFINVTGIASQYGANYYLDFIVPHSNHISGYRVSKVKLARRRLNNLMGERKIQDVMWKGDTVLSQKLNLDMDLKEKLLQADLKQVKYSIEIIPEAERDYCRIRTPYFLPAKGMFEIISTIAKHIKTW
jgi:hypothetical protein